MTDPSAPTHCASGACCEARLARLEKRVCWMRTGLLIALGVLLLLLGIGIGRGGAREERRERVMGAMHRRAMMRGDGPMQGPGPTMGGRPMRERGGPGPVGERRGPGGPAAGPDGRPGPQERN